MFSSIELAHVYNLNKVGLKNFERLVEEHGILSIAGHSHTLNDSVKIVWYNQTRVLRLFTHINDETLVTKYVETIIRRTFGTKDAMKLASEFCAIMVHFFNIKKVSQVYFTITYETISAERKGFEPLDPRRGQRFSRPPHSTTLASLRGEFVFPKTDAKVRKKLIVAHLMLKNHQNRNVVFS